MSSLLLVGGVRRVGGRYPSWRGAADLRMQRTGRASRVSVVRCVAFLSFIVLLSLLSFCLFSSFCFGPRCQFWPMIAHRLYGGAVPRS